MALLMALVMALLLLITPVIPLRVALDDVLRPTAAAPLPPLQPACAVATDQTTNPLQSWYPHRHHATPAVNHRIGQ